MVFSAIQIGSISLVDEGVDQVLDFLGDRVGINALFVATQAFDRGVAGRQVTRKDHPGHGGDHQADLHSGGSFVQQHDEFYTASILGPYRAKDAEVAHFDALGDVMPAAKARGMQVYSFMLENTHSGLTRDLPGWSNVLQVDAWGRSDPYACLRNPDYVSWWLGLAEDQVKTYAPDGIMIGSERNGPLDNALSEGGFARDGNAYCFCVHCLRAGAEAGIDARRARQGYLELDKLLRGETSTDVDSSFIQFLRLLGEYPELISWDRLWHEGYELFMGRLYGAIKFNAPNTQVGWHVWHHNAFSPWYRSQVDFSRWAQFSDFLKPVLYNNCAGYRIHHYVSTLVERVFRGVKPQTVYDLIRGVLGYDENVAFDDLPALGLSPDFVSREVRRTIAATGGRVPVYPGLDVNVPAGEGSRYTSPEDIRASVAATLDAGAPGFVLSRKYSEMTHANLEAVGDLLKERGLR